MNLKGKNALITGGGRGLGKAVAVALANEGVNVGITGRNEEHLKSTVAELEKLGVKAVYSVFNVEEMAQVEQGVASIASQLGGIDILINNAGVGDFGSFEEMPVETWEKVMKVNLFGVYYVAKATLPYLKQNKEGDIVNVASTAGLKGGPNMCFTWFKIDFNIVFVFYVINTVYKFFYIVIISCNMMSTTKINPFHAM